MSDTATTYFIDWQRFITSYQADPSGQFWDDALKAKLRQDEADGTERTPGVDTDQLLDWVVEDPIEACSVYENFHFWTDFADMYSRMRSDIPSRRLKSFDTFVGAFCNSMSNEANELFAPLQDLRPSGQERFYMSVSPQTAAKYLRLGESLKLNALKKPFDQNYNRISDEEEEEKCGRDDFANVLGYWVWRFKSSRKPRKKTWAILSDDELTFHDFDDFIAFILAWVEVLKYAVQNDKGILIAGPVQSGSSQAATPKLGKLVFNGLYIGMPIQDVPQALKSHFPDCKIIDDRGRPLSDIKKAHDLSIEMLNSENGMGMRIIGDGSNRVFSLTFFPKTADLATGFEASLTAQEFVEKLKTTYGLPEMSEVANGWKCTNEEGIIFSVNNKKALRILKPG